MKKLTIWRMTRLLPLCSLLLFFGLTSCQQEEIIPITDADIEDSSTEFILENAEHFLFDENGELTGYMNGRMSQIYDVNGSTLSDAAARRYPNWSYLVPALFYKDGDFNGDMIVHNFIQQSASYGTGWGSYSSFTGISSVVIPPGCDVRLYKTNNHTGTNLRINRYNSTTPYYLDFTSNWTSYNDNIKSYSFNCNNNIAPRGNVCGIGFEHNYDGKKLPFFKGGDVNLGSVASSYQIPWVNTLSTMSVNIFSACDGLMLYEDANDVADNYHWIDPDDNSDQQFWVMGDPTVGGAKLNDKVRRVVDMPDSHHNFRRLESDDNIGVAFYEGENFTGKQHIYPKGNIELKSYGSLKIFKSMVVAPNCTVRFGFNFSRTRNAGYHPIEFAAITQGPIQLQCNDNSNNQCGTAYFHNSSFFSGHGLPILDTGQDINLTSLGNGHWDNEISRYESVSGNTTCEGVAFYKNPGTTGEERAKRYIPAGDGSNTTFTSVMSNKISYLKPGECCGTLEAEDHAQFLRGFHDKVNETSFWNTIKSDVYKTGRSFLAAGVDFGCTYVVSGPGKVALYGYAMGRACNAKTPLTHLNAALQIVADRKGIDLSDLRGLVAAMGSSDVYDISKTVAYNIGVDLATVMLEMAVNPTGFTENMYRALGCLAAYKGLNAAIPKLESWCTKWAEALGPVPEVRSFNEIKGEIKANADRHEEL